MAIEELFRELAAATPQTLRPAALKLTHVGAQKKAIPSVLVSTYHRLPALTDFEPLQEPELNYANDTTNLLHFTVADSAMARIMAAVAAVAGEGVGAGAAGMSIMVHMAGHTATDVPARGAELLLAGKAAESAALAIAEALDPRDGTGSSVMGIFVQAAFGVQPVRGGSSGGPASRTGGTP